MLWRSYVARHSQTMKTLSDTPAGCLVSVAQTNWWGVYVSDNPF